MVSISDYVRHFLHFAGPGRSNTNLVWLVGLVFVAFFSSILLSPSASALTTVPTKMNFQGRLTDSSGNIKADGTYNMRLRLYTASSGGSAVWSEDRLVSAGDGVTLTNGLFSIQLGSVTTLPASLFASGGLYLSVELASPATATSSSPAWTEGAMSPRNQLATSAYAYNAETVDGIDSADLGQLATNNTWTGTQSFTGATVSVAGAANAAKFNVGSIFNVDTSNSKVSVGASDTVGTIFVLDTKTNAGDPTGENGAMYYNSSMGKFRCYEASAWRNCMGGPAAVLTNVTGAWNALTAKANSTDIVISSLYIPAPITVNEMRVRVVTTALGATGDIGIYNSAGSLVLNGGSGSLTTATGTKIISPVQTGSARYLEPGQYYIAMTWNSSTGQVAGVNLGNSGAIARTGIIAGSGGSVLPSSVTISSIAENNLLYAMSINE